MLFKQFIQGASELTPGTNLYTIGVDGTGLRRVTNVGASHYVLAGSFSPDGTSIVFATDLERHAEPARRHLRRRLHHAHSTAAPATRSPARQTSTAGPPGGAGINALVHA